MLVLGNGIIWSNFGVKIIENWFWFDSNLAQPLNNLHLWKTTCNIIFSTLSNMIITNKLSDIVLNHINHKFVPSFVAYSIWIKTNSKERENLIICFWDIVDYEGFENVNWHGAARGVDSVVYSLSLLLRQIVVNPCRKARILLKQYLIKLSTLWILASFLTLLFLVP